jgi:DUF4097 and DUF4098 domain-containing protein YvlB
MILKGWIVKMLVRAFACASVLLLCVGSAAQESVNRIPVSFSDPSRPGLLHVALVNGSISIKGSDSKDVVIGTRTAHLGPLKRDQKGPATVQELPQESSIAVVEQSNRMSIAAANPSITTDLEIQVPNRTSLQLSTVNEGDIRVENVDGELEVGSVNGAITLTHVGGSVLAHTVNRSIVATIWRVSPDKPMAFTSLNGLVDVMLPSAAKANLKLQTDNGSIYSDFKLGLLSGPPSAKYAGKDGLRMELPKTAIGALNGGGPEIDIRTFNGNVYVRKGR